MTNLNFDFTGPTMLATGAGRGLSPQGDAMEADRRLRRRHDCPLGRHMPVHPGRSAALGGAAAFLTSDEVAYMTGVVLPVNGGISM
jgi:NAD(P)-dependent dehydrogenase (short-subunit alcohol dehydrogenase family)